MNLLFTELQVRWMSCARANAQCPVQLLAQQQQQQQITAAVQAAMQQQQQQHQQQHAAVAAAVMNAMPTTSQSKCPIHSIPTKCCATWQPGNCSAGILVGQYSSCVLMPGLSEGISDHCQWLRGSCVLVFLESGLLPYFNVTEIAAVAPPLVICLMMNWLKFPRWIPGCVSLYCWWSGIHCVWVHPMVCLVVST